MGKNSIAESSSMEEFIQAVKKFAKRKAKKRHSVLKKAGRRTREIQEPIENSWKARGHLNPKELGGARRIKRRIKIGQSGVAVDSLEIYRLMCKIGSPYGGAEYAITLSPQGAELAEKIAQSRKAAGAIICPSGLSAISTAIDDFDREDFSKPFVVLLPENAFFAAPRYLKQQKNAQFLFYPAAASADDLANILNEVKPKRVMLWLESPGSGTYEIADIKGIVDLAEKNGARTYMDTTGAHVDFNPLEHGIDYEIRSLTKYAGGFGDAALGVVIAREIENFKHLQFTQKIAGNGAVSPAICALVSERMASLEERLARHKAAAENLEKWFSRQDFVESVLSPGRENEQQSKLFTDLFDDKGNGLFTVVFKEGVTATKVEKLLGKLNIFRITEGFGTHVSSAMLLNPGQSSTWPKDRVVVRFSAGLENRRDQKKDLKDAAKHTFGSVTSKREFRRRRKLEQRLAA